MCPSIAFGQALKGLPFEELTTPAAAKEAATTAITVPKVEKTTISFLKLAISATSA